MVEDAKAPPTLAELEGKVERLGQQVMIDGKAVSTVVSDIEKAMKSNDLARVLELSSLRELAVKSEEKSASQLKTAQGAVVSGKRAANAGKIVAIHDNLRVSRDIITQFEALEKLGVEWVKMERSSETGKLIFNSGGAEVKRSRAPSSNGGSRGTASWDVDGQSFTSRELIDAHQDLLTDKVREHYNSGNFRAFSMTREAEKIHATLTS